jgi:hypothetical protein
VDGQFILADHCDQPVMIRFPGNIKSVGTNDMFRHQSTPFRRPRREPAELANMAAGKGMQTARLRWLPPPDPPLIFH